MNFLLIKFMVKVWHKLQWRSINQDGGSTTKNDADDHVRKNTKNISFGVVRRCSFEHYTCHRNLGKL